MEGEEEGGSIVWPVKGWGLRVYADVLLAKDICSPPVGIVTTGWTGACLQRKGRYERFEAFFKYLHLRISNGSMEIVLRGL